MGKFNFHLITLQRYFHLHYNRKSDLLNTSPVNHLLTVLIAHYIRGTMKKCILNKFVPVPLVINEKLTAGGEVPLY